VIELVRPLTAGRGLGLWPSLVHLGYLIALCVVGFVLAHRRLRVRMFD
jgi:hypothetical protein